MMGILQDKKSKDLEEDESSSAILVAKSADEYGEEPYKCIR